MDGENARGAPRGIKEAHSLRHQTHIIENLVYVNGLKPQLTPSDLVSLITLPVCRTELVFIKHSYSSAISTSIGIKSKLR